MQEIAKQYARREWRRYEVKELIDKGVLVIGDGYRAKNSELSESGLPFARAGNIGHHFQFTGADCFPADKLHLVGEKISKAGDSVFTSKGTVGRFAFVKKDTPRFVYSPQLSFWRSVLTDIIEPRYLYYWMLSEDFFSQFKSVSGQTDMAEYVSLRDQRQMHISAPSLAEQRAIAHILGTLDDKIELNRRINQTLDEMARVLFNSWFVDFDPVRAKAALASAPSETSDWSDERARAYLDRMHNSAAELFPDRFVDSELGEIPEGWEVKALGEMVHVVNGRSYRSGDLRDSDVALVTLKSIKRGGGYTPDGLKPYTGTFDPSQVVRAGDLIVAQTDLTQAAEVIGRPALVYQSPDYQTLVASLDLLVITPEPPLTVPFLYSLLQSYAFHTHALARVNGTTVLHLQKDALPEFRFAVPSQTAVENFTHTVAQLISIQAKNVRESRNLTDQRDALLPKLMSAIGRSVHPI